MVKLTETQANYLSFVHAYIQEHRCSPSEPEIAEAMGVSPPSAHQMMKTLEKKGAISKKPRVPRSIEVLLPAEEIPEWTGELMSNLQFWVLETPTPSGPTLIPMFGVSTPPSNRESAPDSGPAPNRPVPLPKVTDSDNGTIYRVRITLLGTTPEIWREIETPDIALDELHALIQTGMGWMNCHMHAFETPDGRYTLREFLEMGGDDGSEGDESGVWMSGLLALSGPPVDAPEDAAPEAVIYYEYDFGDSWIHEVTFQAVVDPDPKAKYPRCIAGERACPPEDVGGVWGFADLLEALEDDDHEGHEDAMEFFADYSATAFDAKQVTRRMKRGLPGYR